MTFTHKLSRRLAISWRPLLSLVPLAVVLACDAVNQALTAPSENLPSQLLISPDRLGVDYQATAHFLALLRSAAGDTTPATVQWRATGGTITQEGVYTADTVPGEFTVSAEDSDGRTASASVGVGYSGAAIAASSSITRPSTVTDLAVAGATDQTITLSFTEVDDGTGQPAGYDVRVAQDTMTNWGSAPGVTQGTCTTPVQGTAIGAKRTCTVAGLTPTTKYQFRLVAFRGTLNVDAIFSALSNPTSGSTTATPTNPGTVGDLAVVGATDSSVTLSFTEVTNGAGQPASYDIRYAPSPIGWGWGSATRVARGSCAPPVAGTVIGAQRTCTVLGLLAVTAYDVQLVAFRGTLNQDAVFGGLSNVASGATAALPPAAVATVNVMPVTLSAATGDTARLGVVLLGANGDTLSGREVSWSSSAPGVATVDQAGLVKALAAGSATITASSEGQSGSAVVSVSPPAPALVASVAVSPGTTSIYVTKTVQLAATVKDSAGNALTGRTVSWASDNTALATVDASGLVTGKAAGTATITATSEGQSGSATVTVANVPVASITVSPASASLAVGGTQQLTATPKDSAGNPLTGRTIAWASGNSAVATVSSNGLVTGVLAGSATITATGEGKSGTSAITVTAPPPPPPPSSACAPTGSGVCRYVDANAGNDANPGTSSQPYRTIQKAAGVVNPGDVVIVRDGIYTGGSTIVSIGRSGSALNPIVFRAERKWGAVIDGQNNTSAIGIKLTGAYLRVEGFEVRWTSRYGVDAYSSTGSAHDLEVALNHIHHIGRICTDDTGGRSAVDAYSPNLLIEQNVIHDIGRLGPGESGCNPLTSYWTNHDHGVYHGQGNNVVIRNNVFYNLTRGWAVHRYNGGGTAVDGLQILNNTFAFPNPNRDGQIIIATATTNLVIANNIFYQPKTAGIWFSTGSLSAVTVSNNLSYGGGISTGSSSGVVFAGNLNNVDPRFVSASGLNFRLQSGSPAIDAGLLLSTVLIDLDGVLRPQGVRHDIGAYEFK